ncbi:NnrS family protein [Rhizobacter sp. SG703]|uniref:NnrS family protein n=1 Tax=Rhizobacter sp. SG703 TaxID=2587140 RepID=UPI0014482328|nr:NnrS family protein [Rhizobacter sp. SG703]NKI94206.1 uncharacterized protein involved in response to NO [Rhizobacter sp. SG703]
MSLAVRRLPDAPHRLCFAAAGLLLAVASLGWLALLAGPPGIASRWAVAPRHAHGLLMTLGFLPLYMAGFLFTAGPRWLQVPALPARRLLAPVAAMVVGWFAVLAGMPLDATFPAAGMASVAVGWSSLCLRLASLLRASRAADKAHAAAILAACGVGAAAMALAAVALATGDAAALDAAPPLALGGFVLPVFIAASHRMLPFFPRRSGGWLAAAVLVAWCGDAVVGAWRPATPWLADSVAVAETLVAAWLAVTAWRWWRQHGLKSRLVAMLFTGFAWLAVALALGAAAHLPGLPAGTARAALHALAVGHAGSLLIAMVTRIIATHGGRSLAADGVTLGLFLLLQAAAVARVAASLWPAAGTALLPVAAALWAAAMTTWSVRCGAWLLQAGVRPPTDASQSRARNTPLPSGTTSSPDRP